MREPHSEGVANHADLESCAGDGDIAGEALTEALAGRLSSREIPNFGCRPCWQKGKATSNAALIASGARTRRGRRPRARQEIPRARTGRPRRRLPRSGRPVGEGDSRTPHMYAAEESDWAVVPAKGRTRAGNRWRRTWREGPGPRRTSSGAPRTAHRGGQAVPHALDGVRSGGSCRACADAIIRGKSRMSQRSRTDLCGGAGQPASLPRSYSRFSNPFKNQRFAERKLAGSPKAPG